MQRVSIKSGLTGATYFFDTVFREIPTFTNTITQNPVQQGAAISDHIYQNPITLSLEIGVSDCRGMINQGSFSSSTQAFGIIEYLWANSDVLTVTTQYKQYSNMVIKNWTSPKDKSTMNALKGTLTLQQIIVTNAVEISVSQKTTSVPQTTGKTNTGTKSTKSSTSSSSTSYPDVFTTLKFLFPSIFG